MSDYDKKVEKIRKHNAPILQKFEAWLDEAGLAPKTVRTHVENIDFFTEYQTYYEPLNKLDEADDVDVLSFLEDWYPRKAAWASEGNTRSYMASFRKFFKFMVEADYIEQEVETELREMLRENKEEILDAVDSDDGW